MSTSVRLFVFVLVLACIPCAFAPPAQALQQGAPSWQSAMLWYPTLADAGIALADHVNQIDARCSASVQSIGATNGDGPEGAVYGFNVTWACPDDPAESPERVWQSAVLWYPTLAEAGSALADHVNQVDARCVVDVQSIVATKGDGPEGAVYAFAVTWACADGAAEMPEMAWQSAVLWYPTLADAGAAVAELTNQIEAECRVNVDSIQSTNGRGPEGPVYAFAVIWAC